jgi:hypothetical protein
MERNATARSPDRPLDMSHFRRCCARTIIYLGMDVHKESITIAALPSDANTPTRADRLPNDLVKLKRWLERVAAQGTADLSRLCAAEAHESSAVREEELVVAQLPQADRDYRLGRMVWEIGKVRIGNEYGVGRQALTANLQYEARNLEGAVPVVRWCRV